MLTIWAESPEEARNFIRNIYSKVNLPIISGIRVAKKIHHRVVIIMLQVAII